MRCTLVQVRCTNLVHPRARHTLSHWDPPLHFLGAATLKVKGRGGRCPGTAVV